jgi:hypothetical protein
MNLIKATAIAMLLGPAQLQTLLNQTPDLFKLEEDSLVIHPQNVKKGGEDSSNVGDSGSFERLPSFLD